MAFVRARLCAYTSSVIFYAPSPATVVPPTCSSAAGSPTRQQTGWVQAEGFCPPAEGTP